MYPRLLAFNSFHLRINDVKSVIFGPGTFASGENRQRRRYAATRKADAPAKKSGERSNMARGYLQSF